MTPTAHGEAEGGGPFGFMGAGSLDTAEHELPGTGMAEEISRYAGVFLIWGTAFQAFFAAQQGMMNLVRGVIETNVAYQELAATLTGIYGGQGSGQQALNWVDQLSEKLPYTREEIRQASVTLAAAGAPLQQALPMAAELTAARHPEGGITATSQAIVDAMGGRTEMLRVSLRTQIEPLKEFGLEAERSGHIVHCSELP